MDNNEFNFEKMVNSIRNMDFDEAVAIVKDIIENASDIQMIIHTPDGNIPLKKLIKDKGVDFVAELFVKTIKNGAKVMSPDNPEDMKEIDRMLRETGLIDELSDDTWEKMIATTVATLSLFEDLLNQPMRLSTMMEIMTMMSTISMKDNKESELSSCKDTKEAVDRVCQVATDMIQELEEHNSNGDNLDDGLLGIALLNAAGFFLAKSKQKFASTDKLTKELHLSDCPLLTAIKDNKESTKKKETENTDNDNTQESEDFLNNYDTEDDQPAVKKKKSGVKKATVIKPKKLSNKELKDMLLDD